MLRTLLVMLLCCGALLTKAKVDGTEDNNTSGGLFWPSAKESDDHFPGTPEQHDSAEDYANDEFDGGFSSLDGMLQWAIGNSDPTQLKEKAKDFQGLTPTELNKRQMELKELMEKVKMPSDAELMRIAIDDLNNSSLSLDDRHRALQELLILVESIDNANDMKKLGGLSVLMNELDHPDTEIRTVAAWILGAACQNNPVVQLEVLQLGALEKLAKMVKSRFVEEAVKALFAVSALIRNNFAGQKLFYSEAGHLMLRDILSNKNIDIRLRRKAVFLVGDLTDLQSENIEKIELPFLMDQSFLKSVVDLVTSDDIDLQEKALLAIRNLLNLNNAEGQVINQFEFCNLGGALDRMRQLLQDLMANETLKDYVMDVENLRIEIESSLHRKLAKLSIG